MGKNGYLQRQKNTVDVYRQAEKDTYIQYMIDMFMVTLNDPEVMGRDVFGKDRIVRVVHAVEENFSRFELALTKADEADYYQEKLDQRLAKILGKEELVPFPKRYEWIKIPGYGPKRKWQQAGEVR